MSGFTVESKGVQMFLVNIVLIFTDFSYFFFQKK